MWYGENGNQKVNITRRFCCMDDVHVKTIQTASVRKEQKPLGLC